MEGSAHPTVFAACNLQRGRVTCRMRVYGIHCQPQLATVETAKTLKTRHWSDFKAHVPSYKLDSKSTYVITLASILHEMEFSFLSFTSSQFGRFAHDWHANVSLKCYLAFLLS